MDGTVEAFCTMSQVHARGGATAIVPSTLTASTEQLYAVLHAFEEAKKKVNTGARLLGLHLEGPYFSSEQSGAQDLRYLKNPDPEEYLSILNCTENILRVSAAPELPGGLELGRELRRRNIVASIGHSNATYDQVIKAVEVGYTHVTHLYSGMSGVKRENCFRIAGVIESGLLLDDLTVEAIADGRHLPPSLLKLIYKCKGPDRMVLCTDAIRAASMPDGEYSMGHKDGGRKIIVHDGVAWLVDRSAFAGSIATMNMLVKNMVEIAGVSPANAIKMASTIPARVIGQDDRMGCLAKGKDADLVILDNDFSVLMTVVQGRIVYSKSQITVC